MIVITVFLFYCSIFLLFLLRQVSKESEESNKELMQVKEENKLLRNEVSIYRKNKALLNFYKFSINEDLNNDRK